MHSNLNSPVPAPALSSQQQSAYDSILLWLLDPKSQSFLLSGAAGTGKTTVAGACSNLHPHHTVFGAYTGKASRVMQKKGMRNASTIHRMLYTPVIEDNIVIAWEWEPREDVLNSKLIVIDEVSMLSDDLADDLLRLQKPILVLGDVEGQLPPISGTGAFVNRKPDFLLTEIHRFALHSPIAQLANIVRNTLNGQYRGWGFENLLDEGLQIGNFSLSILTDLITQHNFQAIVGYNKTRNQIIKSCRDALGFSAHLPSPGEPLICLKNNYSHSILNGDTLTIKEILEDHGDMFDCLLDFEGETFQAKIYKHYFLSHYLDGMVFRPVRFSRKKAKPLELDFAYAITCHKAQGSEYDNVLLIDDGFYRFHADNRRRWVYTGITRAKSNLVISSFQS